MKAENCSIAVYPQLSLDTSRYIHSDTTCNHYSHMMESKYAWVNQKLQSIYSTVQFIKNFIPSLRLICTVHKPTFYRKTHKTTMISPTDSIDTVYNFHLTSQFFPTIFNITLWWSFDRHWNRTLYRLDINSQQLPSTKHSHRGNLSRYRPMLIIFRSYSFCSSTAFV